MKEELKLYHLNSNSNFSESFFTIATSRKQALDNIINQLKLRYDSEPEGLFTSKKAYKETYRLWRDVNPLDESTYPNFYTFDVHFEGSVVCTIK